MMHERLIEIKIPGAILFLTREEYIQAIKRGKAISRAQKFKKRMEQQEERRTIWQDYEHSDYRLRE